MSVFDQAPAQASHIALVACAVTPSPQDPYLVPFPRLLIRRLPVLLPRAQRAFSLGGSFIADI
jgi:hypothetical protein